MAETKARFLADTQKADTTAEAFTMPTGRATSNNHVLAMTDISAGTTGWQVTSTAPTITGVSGELNTYENSTEDGGTLTLTGTDFGTDASAIDWIKIMKSDGTNQVTASSFGTPTGSGIPDIVFNGSETNYNTFPADTTWYIQVSKSGLLSNRFSSGKSFTKDPTISAITQSVASADYNSGFTGTTGHFGSYGGDVAGGGADSNTKLLLNFDRVSGTDIEDSSNVGGDGHKVTASGNAVIKSSPFGDGKSAIYFDGVDDELELPAHGDWNMSSEYWTIEFWVNFISLGNYEKVFAIGNHNVNGHLQLQLTPTTQDLQLVWQEGTGWSWGESMTVKVDPVIGQWYHIAIVKNSEVLKCYVDGVNTATDSNASIGDVTGKLYFGSYLGQSGWANFYLDEIRIVKGSAVYTSDFTPRKTRLDSSVEASTNTNTKLLLGGGKTSAQVTSDSSINTTASTGDDYGYQIAPGTLTVTGSVHSIAHGGIAPAMAWPASGKATGSAGVYFDGSGDYLRSTSMTPAGTGDYTYDFWFYPLAQTASASYQMIFDTRDGTSNGITLDIGSSTNRLRLWDAVDNNTIIDYASDTAVTPDQWNHIALVRSSGTVTLYIDGVPSTDNDTGNTGNLSSAKISIGQYNQHTTESEYSLKGYIDTFRFSNSARYSSNFSTSLPTKIYGAYGPDNPSIGTIEITASTDDSVDVAFSFQGSTQTNSAVLGSPTGLSLAEHGSDQKKALLTGTLNGTTGTVTNLRIQAKANNDDDRLVEVNEASGVGAISLTKAPGGAPTLFNARRWWGTGVARSITGIGFKPDFVWIKERDADASNHQLQDSIRGTGSVIYSNTSDDEDNVTDRLTSFDSDGFSLSTNSAINGNNDTFVGWCFKAGGAPSGNFPSALTNGIGNGTLVSGSLGYTDIKAGTGLTVKQSVNTNSGFSITTWDGSSGTNNQLGGKIPHNLGSGVAMVMVKRLDATSNWMVFHKDMGTTTVNSVAHPKYALLNFSDASSNGEESITGDGTEGSSSGTNSPNMFAQNFYQYGTNDGAGGVNAKYVMYAWKPVAGVSAFGSYTGTSNGERVYTTSDGTSSGSGGFRPRWIMTKAISNSSSYTSWTIIDAFRSDLSGSSELDADDSPSTLATLYADQSKVENKRAGNTDPSNTKVIIYDDGFKFTEGQDETNSHAGWTYIYIAFA